MAFARVSKFNRLSYLFAVTIMSQASLTNGLSGHDVSCNIPPIKESIPPHKESPSSRKSNPPSEERSTSLVKNALPTENNIGNHTYDPDNIFPNGMKLLLGMGNQQLPSEMSEGNGEDTSNTNPSPSPFEEAHKNLSSTGFYLPSDGNI
ncbi:hypothetical protein P9112_002032 [Eukaryota sp. TZLM1-RC]